MTSLFGLRKTAALKAGEFVRRDQVRVNSEAMLQRRRSAGVTLTALLVLVVCNLAGHWLFISPRSTLTRRSAAGKVPPPRDLEPQLSPDDPYEMPRTPEDEKDMNFWSSPFDDLPAEESYN
eukprot:Skav218682  [mRNA]  locus=scaffold3220:40745:45162:- [translate_table: standard]